MKKMVLFNRCLSILFYSCTIVIILSLLSICVSSSNLIQENDNTDPTQESNKNLHPSKEVNQQLADPEYIKKELKELISRQIDSDKDGKVSFEELKKYLAVLHEKNIEYNVDKQWNVYSPQIHEVFSWEGYEPEKKEVLTWDHYYNQTYPELVGVDIGIPLQREQDTSSFVDPADQENPPKSEEQVTPSSSEDDDDPSTRMLKLMVRRADARWKLADENGDTLLTKNEFKHLLHPDEGHDGLKDLFVKEATQDMDLNKDAKICLDEFMKHLQVLATDQERSDQTWLSSQQENFGRFLDKNKDGVLDETEIKNWLVPPKNHKFEAEAKRLLDIADANDDHKISVAEILEHYDQYISLLPAEYWSNQTEVDDDSPAFMVMGDHGSRDEL